MAVPASSSALALPSQRTAPPKQWDCFLSLAALSGSGHQPISSREISGSTGLSVETIGGILSFLQSVGLAEGSRGKYAVTPGGWAIAEMWQLDPIQGRLLLQGLFLTRWPARLAYGILRDGPVPQDAFVKHIKGETAGHTRRGRYFVAWLVMALLVHRDAAMTVSASSALLSSAHLWQAAPVAPAPSTVQEPRRGVLMGMTHSELRALPPRQYMTVLKHVASLSEMDIAG
ncbi:hypothetical protein [Streptomyces filamentosus]|uniref:hypothetical protein n=1 Tax=Streptomyces filamentosus TaxID=67294 RepID=UPI0033E53B76